MNYKEFKTQYWRTFRSIEDELIVCSKYIAIDRHNYCCYSQAFLKLLLQIGSELDIALQVFCKTIDANCTVSKIDQYRNVVFRQYPDFDQISVVAVDYEITEKPWNGWENSSPVWWRIYNKVKHDRLGIDDGVGVCGLPYYKEANLQNVLNALMALYQVEAYLTRSLMLKGGSMDVYTYKASSLFALDGGQWKKDSFYKPGEMIFKDGNCYIPVE